MTKEETLTYLKAYLNGDTAIGNIIPLRSVLESALEYLEPSLPSNLDEAAEESARSWRKNHDGSESRELFFQPHIRGFKAGAEWMAGQGFSFEDEVYYDGTTPFVNDADFDIIELKDSVKNGDKVIVQIRKK